jgi:hypothetical protein
LDIHFIRQFGNEMYELSFGDGHCGWFFTVIAAVVVIVQ